MIGNIEPYILGQSFDEYEERLEQFFTLNEFDENKRRAFLLVSIGSRAYAVLKTLCHPDGPAEKTYAEIVTHLKEHFTRHNVVAERYKFNQLSQKLNQSMADYISVLKSGAQTCHYNGFLSDALRDRFVCGVRDSKLRDILLNTLDLTFETAEVLSLEYESTKANSVAIVALNEYENHSKTVNVDRLKGGHRKRDKARKESDNTECDEEDEEYDNCESVKSDQHGAANSKRKTCHGCHIYHNIEDCPAQNKHCFKCNKTGHIAAYCSQPADVPATRNNDSGRKPIRYDTIQYRNRGARND